MSGGNGATLWDSAQVLSNYILTTHKNNNDNNNWLKDVNVLELGCGVGLVSIVVGLLGGIVTASERGLALPLLRINIDNANGVIGGKEDCHVINVVEVNWEDGISKLLEKQKFDVILGTDLVFPSNSEVHLSLARMLAELLKFGSVAYIAHESRSVDTDEEFFSFLRGNCIIIEDVIRDVNDGIRILKLTYCETMD